MKLFALTFVVFLGLWGNYSTTGRLSCNSSKNNSDSINLCSYINKPIKAFLSDINKEVVDTIPSKQYTGNLTSIYFKLRNGASYEVLPKMKYSEELYKELRDNFKLGLIADSSIKCIRYIRKGEIVEECGCSKAP